MSQKRNTIKIIFTIIISFTVLELERYPIPEGKASRIVVTNSGYIKNESKWEECFKWYAEKAMKLKEAFNKYK